MKFEKIEEFEMWQKAEAFWDAVNAILGRNAFVREFNTRDQLKRGIDSILANMSEGFDQPTDRAFAGYLYRAKASTSETCTHLAGAQKRGFLTRAELQSLRSQAGTVGRLTSGLIKHLLKTPDRRRGVGITNRPTGTIEDERPPTDE
jgi:four helix bundle protein